MRRGPDQSGGFEAFATSTRARARALARWRAWRPPARRGPRGLDAFVVGRSEGPRRSRARMWIDDHEDPGDRLKWADGGLGSARTDSAYHARPESACWPL